MSTIIFILKGNRGIVFCCSNIIFRILQKKKFIYYPGFIYPKRWDVFSDSLHGNRSYFSVPELPHPKTEFAGAFLEYARDIFILYKKVCLPMEFSIVLS